MIEYCYQCNRYTKSGPSACIRYIVREREAIEIMLPLLAELIEKNLRGHLKDAAKVNSLHIQMEGEIRAELAKVNQGMKNLLEAVKQGALNIEQVKEENTELQETKRRLEKRLNTLTDTTKLSAELSSVLDAFDQNLDDVFGALMQIGCALIH